MEKGRKQTRFCGFDCNDGAVNKTGKSAESSEERSVYSSLTVVNRFTELGGFEENGIIDERIYSTCTKWGCGVWNQHPLRTLSDL